MLESRASGDLVADHSICARVVFWVFAESHFGSNYGFQPLIPSTLLQTKTQHPKP